METGVTMAFLTLRKLRPISLYQSILDNSDEALLRTIVHNDYLTYKQRPTTTENVRIHWLGRRCILTAVGAERNGI